MNSPPLKFANAKMLQCSLNKCISLSPTPKCFKNIFVRTIPWPPENPQKPKVISCPELVGGGFLVLRDGLHKLPALASPDTNRQTWGRRSGCTTAPPPRTPEASRNMGSGHLHLGCLVLGSTSHTTGARPRSTGTAPSSSARWTLAA